MHVPTQHSSAAADPRALISVRGDGRFVECGSPPPEPERGVNVTVVFVEPNAEQMAQLVDKVDDGALTLMGADVLPLDQASAAHTQLEKSGVRGRMVFRM